MTNRLPCPMGYCHRGVMRPIFWPGFELLMSNAMFFFFLESLSVPVAVGTGYGWEFSTGKPKIKLYYNSAFDGCQLDRIVWQCSSFKSSNRTSAAADPHHITPSYHISLLVSHGQIESN